MSSADVNGFGGRLGPARVVDGAARERVHRQIENLEAQFGPAVVDDLPQLRSLLLDLLPADRDAVLEVTATREAVVLRAPQQAAPPPQPTVEARTVPQQRPEAGSTPSSPSVPSVPGPVEPDSTGRPHYTGEVADSGGSSGPGGARTGATRTRGRSSRRTWVVVGALTGALAATVASLVATNDGPNNGPGASSSGGTKEKPRTPDLARATGTELIAAPADVFPTATGGTSIIGSHKAAVEVAGLSEVESVGTGSDALAPPEGGKLIAFRLNGHETCDSAKCRSWRTLNLSVAVDNDTRLLPSGTDTFVVAVPAGTAAVNLVTRADGYPQRISLLDGSPGPNNISILRHYLLYADIKKRFQTTAIAGMRLSDASGPGSNVYYRQVKVKSAWLSFWVGRHHPRSPHHAFLQLEHSYSVAGRGPYVYTASSVSFIGADGHRYRARDLDPKPGTVDLVIEVPASTRRGTLVLGGVDSLEAADGTPYTETTEDKRIPIKLTG